MTEILVNFLQSYVSGFFSGLLVLSLVYLVFWKIFAKKLSKRRIQLTRRAGWEQIRSEIQNNLWVSLAGTAISVTLLSLYAQGNLKFYTDINLYGGIWYVLFNFIFVIMFSDAWFYFFHRLMHHPKLYKYVHAVHHQSLDVTPFTVYSFHIIESFILGVWIIPLSFVVPIYVPMLGVLQILGLVNNIKSHLGYELFPKYFQKNVLLKYLISSTHHNIHHTRYNGNYGLMFTFWDTLFGTEFKETNPTFEQIHDRKNVEIKTNTTYMPLKITRIITETADTRSVYFDSVPIKFLDYLPGQYLNVRIKINGKVVDRIFSLSSSPTQDKFLRLTMKLNGQFTHHIFNKANVGDEIEALLPVGDFYVKPDPNRATNYLLIAGGSGITPIFSILKSLLYVETASSVTLLYANKSRDSKIFAKELDELAKLFPQFKIVDFFSTQKHLAKSDIQDFVEKTPNSQVYICGPDRLKLAVKSYLKEIKPDQTKVYDEDFVDGYVPWFGLFDLGSGV